MAKQTQNQFEKFFENSFRLVMIKGIDNMANIKVHRVGGKVVTPHLDLLLLK